MESPVYSVALTDFRPVRLGGMVRQEDALDYTAWLLAVAQSNKEGAATPAVAQELFEHYRERVNRYGVAPTMIAQRQLSTFPARCIPDEDDATPGLPLLFSSRSESWSPPAIEHRMAHFATVALSCFEQLYEGDMPPDDIIHVSCSGYLSPSPAQQYVSKRAWYGTGVTHSYHMGCYGAFPPVRMATGFLAASHCALPKPKRRVDIVHTELLSMHADFANGDPSAIVNISLFADGFVRYTVAPAAELRAEDKPGLVILAADSCIITDSIDEMSWTPRADVFEMFLSKTVPVAIRDHIVPFVTAMAAQAGIDFERERRNLYFAIHPGGPKILDHIRDALGIDESQMHWSRSVLRENGNMSSATIPYIWDEILRDEAVPRGARIVTMAFGPGLTAAGMILRKI